MIVKQTLFFSAALATIFASALPARADAVLVFDRETTGSLRPQRGGGDNAPPASPNAKQSVTVSLKGMNARVEFRPMGAAPDTAPTTVLLYDGKAQKVYTLNVAAKTYYVESYKEAIDGERKVRSTGDAQRDEMASRVTFSGKVDLKAARANNDYVSKEIAEASYRQYLLTGTAEMKMEMPSGGMSGGGMPNGGMGGGGFPSGGGGRMPGGMGGGFPGGAGGGGRGSGQGGGFTPPSLGVSGEVWYADGTALFDAGRDTPMAAVYRLMLPDSAGPFAAPLMKPLVTQLKNRKSLPGESTISLQMKTNFQNTDDGQTPEATPLTTHLTAKETKTGATLDDAIFTLPTDFKMVEQPMPDFGGRGGRGGQGFRGQGGGRRGNNNGAPAEGTINE